jgi:hypothetical protein
MAKKKEENRETNLKKQEGAIELTGSRLSFPSVPWQSQFGQRWRSHKSIYKTS